MKIALDEKYVDMSNELKKLGYTVVKLQYGGQADAVLYHSHYQNGFLKNINNSEMSSGINTTGVLLIDIKDKRARDIDAVLKRRLYTPLF